MADWKEVELRDICTDISYGYTASASTEPIGRKFLRITDIVKERINWETVPYCSIDENKIDQYKLYIGDIVIARTGATTGYNAIIKTNIDAIFASYLIRYKINRGIAEPFFIGYLLKTQNWKGFVQNIIGGSAQPGANAKQFAAFEFMLPPLPEQRAIAAVLSSLDDKIDLLHHQNKTLEQLAETIFRQWFVEEADGMEEKSLDEIAEFLNGLPCQKYLPNGINDLPVIKIKEIHQGFSDESDLANTDIPDKYIIQDGDVLFSWSGSLEVVIWGYGKGILNQHLFKVGSEKYPKWFYYLWTKHHLPKFRTIASDKATTMGHIQRHHLSDAMVLVPPQKTLKEMDSIFHPMIEKIIFNNKQIKDLQTLRDTLLPKLMSGEVRVSY
jgi:type I restriction enzyme S subunit